MGILKIKEFGCKNFHSFEELVFKVTPGKHLVTGVNGSGKSSIFEVLPWVIYKSTTRTKNPSKDYKGDCFTYVELERDGDEYRIERYLSDKAYGNSVKIILNGEDISKRLKTTSEKDLQELIGLSEELFSTTIVVLQGLPVNFSSLTPTVRKSIIEDMLKFSLWDILKKKISSNLNVKEKEKNQLMFSYNDKKQQMIAINTKIETIKALQKESVDVYKKQLKETKKMLEEKKEQYDSLVESLDKVMEDSGFGYVDLDHEYLLADREYNKVKSEIKRYNSIIENTVCTECGQDYPEDRIGNAKLKLDRLNNSLENKIKKLELIDQTRQVYKIESKKIRELNNEIRILDNDFSILREEIKKPRNVEELSKLEPELQELLIEVNTIKTSMDELGIEVDDLEFLENLLNPSSKFRTNVLKNYLDSINIILDQIIPILFEDVKVQLGIDQKETGLDLLIYKKEQKFDYKSLSGGQRRKLDIALILSLQKFLLEFSGISTNLLVFDEIFDSLDNNSTNLVLNAINCLFADSSSIYIITHNDSVKSMFDSIVQVKIEEGVSKVQL